jgi:hypothetical protein
MLSGYKKQSSEWLLDEIIKEANEVEFPSESNLLFELRSELLSRLTGFTAEEISQIRRLPRKGSRWKTNSI